jgi:hypothetical protein
MLEHSEEGFYESTKGSPKLKQTIDPQMFAVTPKKQKKNIKISNSPYLGEPDPSTVNVITQIAGYQLKKDLSLPEPEEIKPEEF